MGGVNFRHRCRSKGSMYDAYKELVSEATSEYGNDGYNGTISTTSGVLDKTRAFEQSGLCLSDYIQKYCDGGGKWGQAWGICLTPPTKNTNSPKTKITHNIFKGTRKWELFYVVQGYGFTEIAAEKTKKKALEIAKKYAEEHGYSSIEIEKRLVGSDSRVTTINFIGKDNSTDGEYLLFGLAAE